MFKKYFPLYMLVLLLALLLVATVNNIIIFEDESFILGPIKGCLPWGICAR